MTEKPELWLRLEPSFGIMLVVVPLSEILPVASTPRPRCSYRYTAEGSEHARVMLGLVEEIDPELARELRHEIEAMV